MELGSFFWAFPDSNSVLDAWFGKFQHHFLLGPLSMGKKMDLPLAQWRSLLVSKICLLGSLWLAKTHGLHHMFNSWTVLICWESLIRAKETTHIKHASFPFSTDSGKCPLMVQKIQTLTLAPHHGHLSIFAVAIHVPLNQPQRCVLNNAVSGSACYSKKKLQSIECQTFELDTTPRLVGQLKCVQAKVAP